MTTNGFTRRATNGAHLDEGIVRGEDSDGAEQGEATLVWGGAADHTLVHRVLVHIDTSNHNAKGL